LAEILGYKVTVPLDEIMGVDANKIKACIDGWRSLNVSIGNTGQILEQMKHLLEGE